MLSNTNLISCELGSTGRVCTKERGGRDEGRERRREKGRERGREGRREGGREGPEGGRGGESRYIFGGTVSHWFIVRWSCTVISHC